MLGKKRRAAKTRVPAPPRAAKTWQWVMGQDEQTLQYEARKRKALCESRILTVFALVFALCSASALGVPWLLQWKSDLDSANEVQNMGSVVADWPYPKAEEALKAAERYNAKLAASGQPTLGETYDPFASTGSSAGSSAGSGSAGEQSKQSEDVRSDRDSEYMSLLNAGDGLIGSVVIPKISVNLPIRHGTSKSTLDSGSGHLYGTSLPTGAGGEAGNSTHTVLTGHRGLVDALMFTRLDEMRVGDFMYEKVLGRTLAYRVDRITVIEPTDTSQLRIVPGEDRLTLMTCTPYGINTQRLLVSGTRVSMPVPAPAPENAGKDMARILRRSIMAAALAGVVAFMAYRLLPPVRRSRENLSRRLKHRAPDPSA